MSTGTLPLTDVPDEKLEAIGLDRPVASVYDVVALYGRINALLAGERVEGAVSPEYVPYMTPDNEQIQDLYETDNSLLNVHVDISGEEPALAAEELVTLEQLTWRKAIRTGYTRPINKRGPIIAHSIPHHANGKDAERTASYATDRFTRWPTDDRVRQAIPDDEEETVIDRLAELGRDEEAMKQVHDAVSQRIEDIGGTFEGLVSLRIKTEPDGPYRYPGELDIVNEGMAEKKTERMKGYSSADDSSGRAADYVTNEVGTTLGATPGSPVEYFFGKQTEKFPNLEPDDGYQVRPLSESTAADIAAGQAYTAACSVYFGGGIEIRYLPYLETIRNAADVREWAELLDTALNGEQSFRDLLVARLRERSRFAERLKLFQVVVATELDRKDKIITDRSGLDAIRALEIADEHIRALDAWPHSSRDYQGVFRGGNSEYFSLTDPENSHIPQSILTGRYFDETLYNPQRESEDPVFGPDDVRLQATVAVLARSQFPVARVRQSAAQRVIERQNELLGDANTDRGFPFYLVAAQHAQFTALKAAGMIDDTAGLPALTRSNSMPDNTASRDDLLEQFIEDHPVLEDEERRTAFLLGALVGRLSAYQMREGVSTMLGRYPVENITKRNIPRIVNQVLGKNAEYSEKEDGVGLMNIRYQRRLADLLTRTTPDQWSLSTDDIRMHYALGIAYGYSDTSDDAASTTDQTEAEGTPSQS